MSVDVNQLLPTQPKATEPPSVSSSGPAVVVVEQQPHSLRTDLLSSTSTPIVTTEGPTGGNSIPGGNGGRKRKRYNNGNGGGGGGGNNNQWPPQNFNNNKRQKNKQQNIIICGGVGNLPIPSASSTVVAASTTAPAIGGNANNSLNAANNNNNNNCSKSNAENYTNNNNGGGGRNNNNNNNKNFYHKIHFRHLNGGRSRRLQLFPALSKFFLPDKRPRKEIIVPPTKFLLGGNISDPLNLNSLQDDDVEASPKSSPMMTPPKVEVIIPPNIRDPLHLLDPVDSIEYEKQLTSPMKKKMMAKKNNSRHNKKKNRPGGGGGRHSTSFQKDGNASVDGEGALLSISAEIKDENQLLDGEGDSSTLGQSREGFKLELSVDVDLPVSERKRRISENSNHTQGSGKSKVRRLDSIVSPVIPQPGAHKRPLPMGPQGAPHRNRQRTHSVQSTDNEDLQGMKAANVSITTDEGNESLKGDVKEESEANKSSESIKSSGGGGSKGTSETGDGNVTTGGEALEKATEGSGEAATKTEGGPVSAQKESKAKNNNKKGKHKNSVFQFGNYDRYYGYRNLNDRMDVRLQVFQQNEFLFKDKDVLDIGCNVGQLTTMVAKDLNPRSVLGIDIDQKLIRRAKQNVSLFVRVPPVTGNPPVTATQVSGALQAEERAAKVNEEEDLTAVAGPSSSSKMDVSGGGDHQQTQPQESTTTTTNQAHNKSTNKNKRGKRANHKKFAEFFPQSFPLCYGLIPDLRQMATASTMLASGSNSGGGGVVASAAASAGASSMTPTGLLVATGPKSTEDAADQQKAKDEEQQQMEVPKRLLFPNNIKFIAGNYVLKSEHQLANDERHKYDLIMCLSVTKWVHLNYGDVGLKMMFRRIFNQLRPGGKFILEAQNWASYKKRNKLTDKIFHNFQQIEFYPRHFHEYLLSPEVGFSHSYPLGVPRHFCKGFRRPIQLYVKGDYTPSQVMWSDAHHPPQTPYTPYRGIYAEMMCPPPRGYNTNSSVWGGGDNTPFRPMASTSQYYNPMETDSYLPSYETEVSNRRYCFQSPIYSSEWSPPPLSSSNSETRTPPKPSTWSVSTTPKTPAAQGGGSVTNTPHHRHVYPPDEPLDLNENADSEDQPSTQTNGTGVSSSGDTPRTEEDSPEH